MSHSPRGRLGASVVWSFPTALSRGDSLCTRDTITVLPVFPSALTILATVALCGSAATPRHDGLTTCHPALSRTLPQRQTWAASATSAISHTQNSYPRTFTKCYPRAGTLLRKPDWATVDFTSNLEGEMPMVHLPSAIPTVSARSCSELQLGLLPGNQPPYACHACLRTIYVVATPHLCVCAVPAA